MGFADNTLVRCPDCGAEMLLRETSKFTTKDGKPRKFYGCSNYPKCKATHGAHPSGQPLGHPADEETKKLRIDCHRKIDEWVEYGVTKRRIYKLLSDALGCSESEVHFGGMDKEQCLLALEVLNNDEEILKEE